METVKRADQWLQEQRRKRWDEGMNKWATKHFRAVKIFCMIL